MPPIAPSPSPGLQDRRVFAEVVRLLIAPLVCVGIGFITADFLLSGVYTWPRTSRILAVTVTVAVLSYEFVFKEHAQRPDRSPERGLKAVTYSCLLPYVTGFLSLLGLAHLGS